MINKIKIITIGKIKEKYIKEGTEEFLKRIKIFSQIEIIEIKDRGIKEDTENILEIINKQKTNNIFILDEKGVEFSSLDFSNFMNKIEGEIVFIIGGAYGLEDRIKKDINLISLSKMTFIHEMARLFLLEQIYRGFMIINNRNYHK